MNRIRRRTIPALTNAGINHELVLIPTTTLFDKPELRLINPTVEQVQFVWNYFRECRSYKVKVSSFGCADVNVSRSNVEILLFDVGGKYRVL